MTRAISQNRLRGPRGLCIAVLAKACEQVRANPQTGRNPEVRSAMQRNQEDAIRWLQGRDGARIPAVTAADAAGYSLEYVQQRLGLS